MFAAGIDRRQIRGLQRRGRAIDVPRRISLQVTNHCDSRCTHCSIWKIYRDETALARQELRSDELLAIVRNALDWGVQHVDVTGGEPFLRKVTVDILTLILQRTRFACITTNALRVDPVLTACAKIAAAAPAAAVFVVSVSIDGMGPANDQIRGQPESFTRAVQLLRGLRELRTTLPAIFPQVSFTLLPENAGQMRPLMMRLIADGLIDGCDAFSFRPADGGHYYGNERDRSRYGVILDTVESVVREFNFGRSAPFLRRLPGYMRDPEQMVLPCYAGFVSLWIDCYGNVSPCLTMADRVLGNLRSTDYQLKPIWTGAGADAARAEISAGRCAVCWTDCQACESLDIEEIEN